MGQILLSPENISSHLYIVIDGEVRLRGFSLNKKNADYDVVAQQHQLKQTERNKFLKEKNIISKSLELSNSISSNKVLNFRVLAQIASAVPKRVKFSKIEYNGADLIMIEGSASSDQDILKLISNLKNKKLIKQASLANMNLSNQSQGTQAMKGFKIACILEMI